ncbi:putative S-adenosylmethionine-dependent methyltransferase [Aspergillus homomorphus CBS 101889]|uniref:Protein-lysine N-methyltransferase EFM4 n=1 Tax=Aspergillus homomorphus (strain CBS 101889) TaxID=1450537 RepID=A0A395HFS5_ASPHC|nr:hypothetical protein BO97DRAFT_358154 [Aspergillus homomorphus CBS 101889]RAL06707.1 hypothetical protein BO97DRAFT_358154 [Aspergillus homomorphus CBS 101889]
MADNHPTYLEPSELGTKDYWETFYARTLSHLSSKQTAHPSKPTHTDPTSNSQSDDGSEDDEDEEDDIDDDSDPGTSWFSEHNAPDKVLEFLTGEEFPLAPCNTLPTRHEQPKILDLGTGNGSMLALLRKRGGFRGEMVGVDYSAQSVELARRLQRLRIHRAYLSDSEDEDGDSEGEDGGEEEEGGVKGPEIRFEEWDILSSSPSALISLPDGVEAKDRLDWFPYERRGFDIVLDKGTFDAVSLSAEEVLVPAAAHEEQRKDGKKVQRRVCERYPGIARALVRPGGFLVVTSCNWTEEELVEWFTAASASAGPDLKDRLVVWGRVEYPRFRFGGREGQGVCTVCFQRVVD